MREIITVTAKPEDDAQRLLLHFEHRYEQF